ncbi:MAG: hypothetical protein JXB40_02085 [Candidatus Omnitrophica bacterium]|nr:hypothetical protein [Candidatus Omnitrophota bacterium]
MPHKPRSRADLSKIRTIPLNARKCKVSIGDFAHSAKKGESFRKFYDSLPRILAAQSLRAVSDAVVTAYRKGKMIIIMMGAHVIKCGISPLIIDLMKRGVLKAVALNGAGVIHDTEIAMIGRTSEDVGEAILDGSFGMAKETAGFINQAISAGFKKGIGIGESVGGAIVKAKLPHSNMSILANAYKLNVPVTAHVAIGTDIIHQHPSANGAAIGEGSLLDFKNFIYSVSRLEAGVLINLGSAVILPEVFLKAITVARNLGHKVDTLTTANFDMISQYRPHQNILSRPTSKGGKGINIIGHHEIMIPLLYRSIIERI